MMNYIKINNILGWLCFITASTIYILTLEPTASFWDCGEFIAAAHRLQIVHQPGAPLFLMIEKVFSLLAFGDKTKIAYWMNVGSALASGATILFLFWTITALAKKALHKADEVLTGSKLIMIMGAGLVGALAYAFSDTFWFSAVEAEVYALSSLCTAVVFWAVLKWDAHADESGADKWLVFIAYIMGLSIGVHLLNLLVIPAIALVYYFRRASKTTSKGAFSALLIGILILGFIQYGVIQYLVKFAAYFDLFFVNTLGMGFGSGVIFFAFLLITGIVYGVSYSIKKNKPVLNFSLICLIFILLGYGSFAMIVIRAKANPSLNNSDPENVFALLSYLNREQYGDRPLLYGQYFDSKVTDYKEGDEIYRKGKDKYVVAGRKFERTYDRNTLLPRMYSDEESHVEFYRDWMNLAESQSPTFLDNIGFLFSYQTGFMYVRYFLWNFVGRQNDDQGHGSFTSGNWLSGIKRVDALRLGSQDGLPPSIVENKAYNRLYFLPFILGLIGAFWHFKRQQKDAGVVALLFFFTGLAIVLYLNQTPLQPRERDYAYAGSFYAFAIWIGMGVAGIAQWAGKRMNTQMAAVLSTILCLIIAPVLMAKEEWDDHNRSEKTVARDLAIDYLQSCAPNAILFTYGDNDTYPLWYVQEVEGIRTDVRIVNLSLLGTDWYIRQMKKKMNQSAPLPITMPDDKFVQGVRDVLYYSEYPVKESVELKNIFDILTSDDEGDKIEMQDGSKENFLPTKEFKITIDSKEVLATKTVPAKFIDSITPTMVWKYNKNYVSKTELAMIDILAHNDWKRPVYFATTVPNSNFIGLDNYLYKEGLALRLLPLKTTPKDSKTTDEGEEEKINTEIMYHNMMNKFLWGNMKNAEYLDPETSRMINILLRDFNSLAQKLYEQGQVEKARKVILKSLAVIPDYNYSFYTVVNRFYTVDLLYKLHELKQAKQLTLQTAQYIKSELNYMADISKNKENLLARDIRTGLYVLNQLIKMAETNQQKDLAKNLNNQFKQLEGKFFIEH